MKYAILSERKTVLRLRDTEPVVQGVVAVEVTDEVAASIQSILDAKEQPIYTDGTFVSMKSLIVSGKMVRFNEETKEWDITTRPISVPKEVPMWAFREVIFLDDGLRSTYDGFMSVLQSQNQPLYEKVNNYIEYGNFIVRSSPTLAALAQSIGKDSSYIDDVFIRASKKSL
jgi:hypothetical protein